MIGGPYGPYFQSERLDRYRAMTERLVASGNAYYCYCTQDELKAKREAAERQGGAWRYDRTCLSLTPRGDCAANEREQKPRVVRVRVPEGDVRFDDLVARADRVRPRRTSRTSSSCDPTAIRRITCRSCLTTSR